MYKSGGLQNDFLLKSFETVQSNLDIHQVDPHKLSIIIVHNAGLCHLKGDKRQAENHTEFTCIVFARAAAELLGRGSGIAIMSCASVMQEPS